MICEKIMVNLWSSNKLILCWLWLFSMGQSMENPMKCQMPAGPAALPILILLKGAFQLHLGRWSVQQMWDLFLEMTKMSHGILELNWFRKSPLHANYRFYDSMNYMIMIGYTNYTKICYLSIYLLIYLSIYLTIYLYLSIYLSIYISIYINQSVYLSIYLPTCLSIYLPVYLSNLI